MSWQIGRVRSETGCPLGLSQTTTLGIGPLGGGQIPIRKTWHNVGGIWPTQGGGTIVALGRCYSWNDRCSITS